MICSKNPLIFAVEAGKVKALQYLLSQCPWLTSGSIETAMRIACNREWELESACVIIGDERAKKFIQPSKAWMLCEYAIKKTKFEVVKHLLDSSIIEFNFLMASKICNLATDNGATDVLALLLSYVQIQTHVNASALNDLIRNAPLSGCVSGALLLLTYAHEHNLSYEELNKEFSGKIFNKAIQCNHPDIVKEYLTREDFELDPIAAIKLAVFYNQPSMIALLLTDERIASVMSFELTANLGVKAENNDVKPVLVGPLFKQFKILQPFIAEVLAGSNDDIPIQDVGRNIASFWFQAVEKSQTPNNVINKESQGVKK